ncbi:ribosomal protein S18-alanine N-acetyltransferase [Aeromicrobium sp.]|uniref:ribosomal protein S18-alanine N-acetyltransferase n=1 Tax=Aeromicrobium sp. TaxID=1871063 RepID=UPI00351499A2
MIRPALETDLPVLLALEGQAFAADAWSEPTLRAEIAHPGRAVLVAESDATVVGYVDVGVGADVAALHRVAVAPTHRRRGLASQLVEAGRDAARERGAERMLLEVAADNDPALALYAAHGFAQLSRRRGYYAGGRDALVLQVGLTGERT